MNNSEIDENNVSFADFSNPENIWEKEERDNVLHIAIQQLKEPYKQVVVLRSFNELSFKEIGNIFEESENWARVTFHRGKQKLREILKKGKFN
ncbi:RNA polymerase sigma factor [Bacillus solitudinis]|uniref:RNA polymerase sigma factor n=1 Tax=Bacillus solitudinis TaxID=2014074 RepID=UPI000C233C2E|nr:sigma-70 family RNA polymerase sigma factor [Bacillus solitudinis]